MKLSTITACVVVLGLSGCAGQLLVFDDTQNEIKGVPFRAAEVYIKTGFYSKHTKGDTCTKSPFVDTVSLPTGARYYVTAKTAQFSKTAFHIKFSDNGAVAEIGLDSEPSGSEMLKATNDLIKTLIPSLGAASAAAAGGGAAPIAKACDTGEADVAFIRLDEYIKGQRK